jgi:carbamoyltransferase|tara:strand:- start:509 stop:1105 length:597 start_codon:yes stop_codon:yes gene_type:complete
MKTLYLGPKYDLSNIQGIETNYDQIAHFLASRKTVAIFQGRSEAGPRALGNRSILYDPRDPDGKDKVNIIKKREAFRPFAASVLLEDAPKWFDMAGLYESPHMMYAMDCFEKHWKTIPAVLHVDHTCRIQTVTSSQNLHYFNLIKAFKNITKVPMLFNTSFNLAGDPLVETPRDAIDTFMKTEIDYLYFPEVKKVISK